MKVRNIYFLDFFFFSQKANIKPFKSYLHVVLRTLRALPHIQAVTDSKAEAGPCVHALNSENIR